MDIRIAQLRFQQKLHNHLQIEADIRTVDIEYFFTKAQEIYIDSTYVEYKGQESLRKRLAGVYKDDVLDTTNLYTGQPPFRNGSMWVLPNNVRYVLDEYVINKENTIIPVKPVDASYYNKQSKNPYKKPYGQLVWRLDRGDSIEGRKLHELICLDSITPEYYGIVYIKTPADIKLTTDTVVGFEVSEEYHSEIIDIAVNFALSIYGRQREDVEQSQE